MSLPPTNLLLQSLPQEVRAKLTKHLERVNLPIRTRIFEAEEKARHVHLLTSGIASIVTVMQGGETVEVGLAGREGFPERLHLLGGQVGGTECVVQVAATGLRMEFGRFKEAFLEHPALLQAVHQYVQHDGFVLQQLGACNRLHEVEARMARWLLMVHDRIGEPELKLPQEFLAQMLGVRRSSVNLVANALQHSGAITYKHGVILVQNRELLESQACECYPVIAKLDRNLYSQ